MAEGYPRYLQGRRAALRKIGAQLQRDRVWSGELGGYWEQYQARLNKHQQEGKRDPQLALYRWMLEEYRVSLWAQQLGTGAGIRQAPEQAMEPGRALSSGWPFIWIEPCTATTACRA